MLNTDVNNVKSDGRGILIVTKKTDYKEKHAKAVESNQLKIRLAALEEKMSNNDKLLQLILQKVS